MRVMKMLVFSQGANEHQVLVTKIAKDMMRSGLAQMAHDKPLVGRLVDKHCNYYVHTFDPILSHLTLNIITLPNMTSPHVRAQQHELLPPFQVIETSKCGEIILVIHVGNNISDATNLLHAQPQRKQNVSPIPLLEENGSDDHVQVPIKTYDVHIDSIGNGDIDTIQTIDLHDENNKIRIKDYDHEIIDLDIPTKGRAFDDVVNEGHKEDKDLGLYELVMIDIPLNLLHSLVNVLHTEELCECDMFDALMAHVWTERTRVLEIPRDADIRLFFMSKDEDHKECIGNYGSFTYNCQAIAKACDLIEQPLSNVVKIIQSAKLSLRDNFIACMNDFKNLHDNSLSSQLPLKEVLMFTEIPIVNLEVDNAHFENTSNASIIQSNFDSHDFVYFPSHINIAAIAPPPHSKENNFRIFINNVPSSRVEEIQSLISNLPLYILSSISSSKL